MSENFLEMTDEEFAKLSAPPEASSDETPEEKPENEAPESNLEPTTPKQEGEGAESEEPAADEPKTEEGKSSEAPSQEPESELPGSSSEPFEGKPPSKPTAKTDSADKAETPTQEQEDKAEEPEKPENSNAPDYEAFYKQVMAPFKANGKMIQLQSPEEVVQLMQMGANYTKKMQALQHSKKYLMMLENNGLLDENKLSFLIDLDKKNPDAIKKLLQDANLDPLEMDTSAEVQYKGGAHAVSDQEASLAAAIEDLNSVPGGSETLKSIQSWDATSKKLLWDNPELIAIIHSQRENGIYDAITAEMERRRLLGRLSPSMSFLQAYRSIGDEMLAQGAFKHLAQPASSAQPPVPGRTPVAIRPAKTPATKAADNRVRAAAPPRSTTPKAKDSSINPLAMSDEEFLKRFANKV